MDETEQERAASLATPRALVIHEIIRDQGETELERTSGALAFSGFAAGLSMGFSFLTQSLIESVLPDAPWRPLLASFGYSLGFIIVILGRQQLFTESTLTAVLPVLTRRDRGSALAMLRLWAIVLATNWLGTILFAAALSHHGVFPEAAYRSFDEIGRASISADFGLVLLKAIFAGWLIALIVWLFPSAGSARLFIILLLTYVVALGHLSHIIAGSVDAAYAVFSGRASVAEYFSGFFAPTLIGNTIGGVALVALLNHAPVAPELKEHESGES